VIFMVARRPGVGSGSSGRAPDVVVATPPTQPVVKVTNRSGEQCGEQVLDLVAGQPDQPQRGGMAGALGHGRHDQEGVGEHGKGGPAVPGAPAADLVVVQSDQALAGLEALFHRPAHSGEASGTG
jgi:hypothetical protein